VTSTPVSTPVASQPVTSVPVTTFQNLTPPPAAAPVSIRKVGKKKPVNKHTHVHIKTVHHPRPNTAAITMTVR
jgi:hypothetical protein